jgi:ATP adenylyltransferase
MLHHMTSEPEQQIGVGTQDAFQRLWTPHRMAYIQGENKPTGPGADDGCPFCSIPAKSDEDGLIVRRGEQVYAVLNLYPYNGGHLMVVPYRHVADYTDLTDPETAELGELTKQAMTALRTASGAHGFNIGMNQGTVAGAGIAAHLHQHIVPRWGGDTNFMPVVGHTKVLPQLLADTRKMLAEAGPRRLPGRGCARVGRGAVTTCGSAAWARSAQDDPHPADGLSCTSAGGFTRRRGPPSEATDPAPPC